MSGIGGGGLERRRYQHDVQKIADLSPNEKGEGLLHNGLANEVSWVLAKDPDTGVPTQELRGRPSPYNLIPVKRDPGGAGGASSGGGGADAIATTLRESAGLSPVGTGDRGSAPERLGLNTTVTHPERAQEPVRGAYPLLTLLEQRVVKNLSTAIIQIEGAGAIRGEIARAAPWSDLLRVVGDKGCLSLDDRKNDPWHVAFEDRAPAAPVDSSVQTTVVGGGSVTQTTGQTTTRDPGNVGSSGGAGQTTIRDPAGGAGGGGGADASVGGASGQTGAVTTLPGVQSPAFSAGPATGGFDHRPMRDVLSWAFSELAGGLPSGMTQVATLKGGAGGAGGGAQRGGLGGAVGGSGVGQFGDEAQQQKDAARLVNDVNKNYADWQKAKDQVQFATDQYNRIFNYYTQNGQSTADAAGQKQIDAAKGFLDDASRQERVDRLLFVESYMAAQQNPFISMDRVEVVNGSIQVVSGDNGAPFAFEAPFFDANGNLQLGIGGGVQVDSSGNVIVGANFPTTEGLGTVQTDANGNIIVGAGSRTLSGATVVQFNWPVGSPQYNAGVAQARDRYQRVLQSGATDPGTLQYLELLQSEIDDGNSGLPLGTTWNRKHGKGGAGGSGGGGSTLQKRLAILLDAPWTIQSGAQGFPLAFDSIGGAIDQPRGIITRSTRWGVGHFALINNFWRPVVPTNDQVPGDGGGPEDPKKKKKKKRKGGKKGAPDGPETPDPGGGGGKGDTGGGTDKKEDDGELTPCDRGTTPDPGNPHPNPGEPQGHPEPTGEIPGQPGGTVPRVFLPGTDFVRAHPFAGATAINPAVPDFDELGDERQALGGGPYMRGAPIVPRGGIRLFDRFDFAPFHTTWDVHNAALSKINQLVSFVNERFPFAPDAISGGGFRLPAQPMDRVQARLEQFDPGTIVHIVETPRATGGSRTFTAPYIVDRDLNGQRRLRRLAGDHLPTRTIGTGQLGADIEIRFDTGLPGLRPGGTNGQGLRGDAQPKITWRGDRQDLEVDAPAVAINTDSLQRVGGDGTTYDMVGATGTGSAIPANLPSLDASKLTKARSFTVIDLDGLTLLGSKNVASFRPIFDATALTADRTYTFPNASGTFALGPGASGVGTLNKVARWGASGLVDSAIVEDGSNVTVNEPVAGGSSASGNLTLKSTTNATKGSILFGASGYDEVNDRLGVGVAAPSVAVHIKSKGDAPNLATEVWVENQTTGGFPRAQFQRSADGKTALTLSGQILGIVGCYGYDGAAYQAGAEIWAETDGVPAAGKMPGRFRLFTTDTNGTRTERMRVDSAGNVGIAKTAATGYRLDVSGKIRSDSQIESSVATGTAPLTIASTTAVTNLNADMVDGAHASTTPGAGVIPIGDANGRLTKAQQQASTAYTDQANTFTAGAQDFTSAGSLRLPQHADPLTPATGEAWVRDGDLRFRDGLPEAQTHSVEVRDQKGAPGGYAALDPNARVPRGSMPSAAAFYDANGTWLGLQDFGAATGLLLPRLSADPTDPARGQVWVNGSALKYADDAAIGKSHAVEVQDNKNVVNGYAGLDGTGRVAIAQQASTTEYTTNKNQANGYAGLTGGTKLQLAQAQQVIALTDLTDVAAKSGSGSTVLMQGSPTLTTPTIVDLSNANHNHQNAAGGGSLDAAAIGSGALAKARQAATTVYTDQGNTFTTGTQSFTNSNVDSVFGRLRGATSSPVVSGGSTYTVGTGDNIVLLDCSSLAASATFNIVLPQSSNGRFLTFVVTKTGGAGSLISFTVTGGGNVQGATPKTISATSLSGVTMVSDGTNFYYSGSYGIA